MPDINYGRTFRAGHESISVLSDLSLLMEDRGIFPDHKVLSGCTSGLHARKKKQSMGIF